jgi:hypothetical protein
MALTPPNNPSYGNLRQDIEQISLFQAFRYDGGAEKKNRHYLYLKTSMATDM